MLMHSTVIFCIGLELMIILIISVLIIFSLRCEEIVKNSQCNSTEPNVVLSEALFFPKSPTIQLTMIENR